MDDHELARLHACTSAWEACFMALIKGNPDAFRAEGLTGIECAVREIKRLQDIAAVARRIGHALRADSSKAVMVKVTLAPSACLPPRSGL